MNIALVGNPNVGKSVIFNILTGKYVTVSNYPGTTVEISKGSGKFEGEYITVIDTPGVNSLEGRSEDEKVTQEILSQSDIACIVQVADAKNLKRSLLLTVDLARLGIPMVLDLNMSDEAKERGITIDTALLSERLGVDIVQTVAVTGEGVSRLKEAVTKARVPKEHLQKTLQTKKQHLLLAEKHRFIDSLMKGAVHTAPLLKESIAEMISRLTLRPSTGIPILLGILFIMYQFVGRFAAGTAVDFLRDKVFGGYIMPKISVFISSAVKIELVKDFLIGDYGLISMALTYSVAIIFPIVTAFFLFFGFLEDSGYLPRLSVLSDRIFKVIGLNGRAILPIILGLGCGTMATLTARILDTKKERLLVTLLLALVIPCSAQLGVIMGVLGTVSAKALIVWFLVLLAVMVLVGTTASAILPGERTPFIQELPPIRMPQFSNIVTKTFARIKWYLKEAVPLFLAGTAVLFVLDKTGLLCFVMQISAPVIKGFLNLPVEMTNVFIIGFLRRDYGAAGLYVLAKNGVLDSIQTLVSVVVITLFVPCIAQFFVTIKERGLRTALLIAGFVFVFAFLAGGAINFVFRYLLSNFGVSIV